MTHMLNFTENLPATAEKGTGSMNTPSREFTPDKERFSMASMQHLIDGILITCIC